MTKKPKPEPEAAPRDWGHHQAKLAEHINRLEARIEAIETAHSREETGPAPLTGAEYERAFLKEQEQRYTTPPGVVPPHVRENLQALAEWAEYRPVGATDPMGILANMRRLIGIALEGGDVPRMKCHE